MDSLKCKVISNSSFTLSFSSFNFLCVARNLEKKNKTFVHTDKYVTTALATWLRFMVFNALKYCSKLVSEIRYIHPVIVVAPVIRHKMLDAGTNRQNIINRWPHRSMWVRATVKLSAAFFHESHQ